MISLEPIAESVQRRLFEKMAALGRETSYSDSPSGVLTQQEMLTRSTFIKMCSGQTPHVVLMGGETTFNATDQDGYGAPGFEKMAEGYRDIYDIRVNAKPKDWYEDMWAEGYDSPDGITEKKTKRPMPGIKSIEVTFKGGKRAAREAIINWTCWSFDDINRLKDHFLSHGKTVLLEWGWIYNNDSIINLPTFIDPDDGIKFNAYKNYAEDVLKAQGDFDMMVGKIANFEFTTRSDGAFDCQTILMSVGVALMTNPMSTEEKNDSKLVLDFKGEQDPKKIREILKKDPSSLNTLFVSPNLTLKTLIGSKTFLPYMVKKVQDEFKDNVMKFGKEEGGSSSASEIAYNIRWAPKQFLMVTSSYPTTDEVINNTDLWIRWGWFEDNILSKFLCLCTTDPTIDIMTELRSIEPGFEIYKGSFEQNTKLYAKFPTLKGASFGVREKVFTESLAKYMYVSTKIRNSEFLETIDIANYILPGQFNPTPKDEELTKATGLELSGDDKFLIDFAKLINDKNNFSPFAVNDTYEEGYFRNILVNYKLIQKIFNTETDGVESTSIGQAIRNLVDELNKDIGSFWNLTAEQDSVEHHRVKIIDSSISKVDFKKPLRQQRSSIDNANGIFYFPIWRQDSIVKTQNLRSKVFDEMSLAVMYGSDISKLKSLGGAGGFGGQEGVITGGLSRIKESNIEFDYGARHSKFFKVGNTTGDENEPITQSGGLDPLELVLIRDVAKGINKTAGTKTDDAKTETIVYDDDMEDFFKDYDASIPAPPLNHLTLEEKKAFFEGAKDSPAAKKEIEETYGSKYNNQSSIKGYEFTVPKFVHYQPSTPSYSKMKDTFVNSVKRLIQDYGTTSANKTSDKDLPYTLPLEIELSIDGTGGIYPGNSFNSSYVSKDYQDKTVFQMFDVNHVVDSNGWTTNITGKMKSTYNTVFEIENVLKEDLLTKDYNNYRKNIVGLIGKEAYEEQLEKDIEAVKEKVAAEDSYTGRLDREKVEIMLVRKQQIYNQLVAGGEPGNTFIFIRNKQTLAKAEKILMKEFKDGKIPGLEGDK